MKMHAYSYVNTARDNIDMQWYACRAHPPQIQRPTNTKRRRQRRGEIAKFKFKLTMMALLKLRIEFSFHVNTLILCFNANSVHTHRTISFNIRHIHATHTLIQESEDDNISKL